MEFYDFTTQLKLDSQLEGFDRKRFSGEQDYLEHCIIHLDQADVGKDESKSMFFKLWQQFMWVKAGKPSYHVHPRVIETFSQSKLDHAPMKMIQLPHRTEHQGIFTEIFLIQLPKTDNYLYPVRSILASLTEIADKELEKHQVSYKEVGKHQVSLSVEHNETQTSSFLAWDAKDEDRSVDEAVDEMATGEVAKTIRNPDPNDAILPPEMYQQIMRLVLSTAFLVKSKHPLIEPNVLNVDLDKFYATNDKPIRDRLIEKAAKRRKRRIYKFGVDRQWRIGLTPHEAQSVDDPEMLRGPLTEGHLRKGHWRRQRHGPGRKQVDLIWIMPTIVRPDLPLTLK